MPCILISGRGFPDLATRAMVHQLSHRFQLPAFGLADSNPFGVALLMTYKLGSARMGAKFSVDLKWLGFRPSQLNEMLEQGRIQEAVLQEFSERDKAKLKSLIDLLQEYDFSDDFM